MERVGHLRILRRLGEGGMGVVYEALDERLERKVAIKALRRESRLGEKARARFLREAKMLSRLDHPNICRLLELVEGEASDYLVLELVEGRTLKADRLRWIHAKPRRRLRRLLVAALMAVLATATAVSTVGFQKARRAQREAETSERQARRAQSQAEAVNAFLEGMLESADPERLGIEVKVIDVLDRARLDLDERFAEHPRSKASILTTLGRTYRALGELSPAHDCLG